MIYKLNPMVALQYINVSIDVIINLKFEDIENKMLGQGESDPNSMKRSQAMQNLKDLRSSMLDDVEVKSLNTVHKNIGKNDKDDFEIDETPRKIREKIDKNIKMAEKEEKKGMLKPRAKTDTNS
jgi:hypothetical protein